MHVVAQAVGVVLLEETFALAADRAPQQPQRPTGQLRQQPPRDAAVVIGHVALGVGGAGEHDAFGVPVPLVVARRAPAHGSTRLSPGVLTSGLASFWDRGGSDMLHTVDD